MASVISKWVMTALGTMMLAVTALSCGDGGGFPPGCMRDWTCTTLTFVQCEAVILVECDAEQSDFQDGTCTLRECGGANGCIFDPCNPSE